MEQYGNINARKCVIGGPLGRYTALGIPKHDQPDRLLAPLNAQDAKGRASSFWWERSFLRRLIQERVDAAFANPNDNAEELLGRYENEKTVIEWVRMAGAGLLLASVLIALLT